LGSPTIVPTAPSSTIWQVALPWMPILCSRPAQKTGLREPSEPSAFTLNFGTTNSEMPLEPAGASGRRASTRCRMLETMSWSPAEMKILAPVILKVPSPCGSALERSRPRSVPQWGSVRHIVPVHSPEVSLGRYCDFCSGVPWAFSASYAPCDRPGYIVHAWLPLLSIS